MEKCIADLTPPIFLNDQTNQWWDDEKLGDWAEEIFREFSKRINQPIIMRKGIFHELIEFVNPEEIDQEISEKLDALYEIIKPA